VGERTKYAPGTFSWVDLATPDQAGAKAFYAALFGWDAIDNPVGDGVVYSIMLLDGKSVAAITPQPQRQIDAGVPPLWQSYVTVESADATAALVAGLGGDLHVAPFDVMSAGRMAVIADPQGAFFQIWEPGDNIGAQLVNQSGALVWNELASADFDGAEAFYGGLFGWTFEPMEGSPSPYLVIKNAGASNGGITTPAAPDAPPYWLPYFGIEEIEAGVAKVTELGGNLCAGPIDIGIAKIAVVSDPQGAVFALYAGVLEP
jgi:hypothetical protein